MIDLATLTGAIIVALGHEKAGVFANDDALPRPSSRPPGEGEGAWRMPLGAAYDKLLKSRIADMKNTGGRPAGSITAAQFLRASCATKRPGFTSTSPAWRFARRTARLRPRAAPAGACWRSTGWCATGSRCGRGAGAGAPVHPLRRQRCRGRRGGARPVARADRCRRRGRILEPRGRAAGPARRGIPPTSRMPALPSSAMSQFRRATASVATRELVKPAVAR
jgi:hypothetical protein